MYWKKEKGKGKPKKKTKPVQTAWKKCLCEFECITGTVPLSYLWSNNSTASELNALASTTALDLYRRNHRKEEDAMHYVKATKWFTLGWGILAIIIACLAYLAENLIQLVNIIGSIFYGNVLGIFLLAFFIKYVRGHAVFVAAIITQILIIAVWYLDLLPYLWLNLLGCFLVMSMAIILQTTLKSDGKAS